MGKHNHSSFYSVTLHLCWRYFVSLKSTPSHEMLLGHNPEMKPKLKTLVRHYIVFWKYSHWQIQLIISAKPPIFLCNNLLMDSVPSFPSFHLMTAAQLCDLCVSDSWCGKTPKQKTVEIISKLCSKHLNALQGSANCYHANRKAKKPAFWLKWMLLSLAVLDFSKAL